MFLTYVDNLDTKKSIRVPNKPYKCSIMFMLYQDSEDNLLNLVERNKVVVASQCDNCFIEDEKNIKSSECA